MLRPQDNAVRETKRLDGLWDFVVDTAGAGRAEEWWRGPLPDSILMPVPSSYNDVLVDQSVHDHVGDVWYQRTVFVPRGWDGQRIVLRFDAATHRGVAWVDDAQVVQHEGGYTPFEADITAFARAGQPLRITAVVNNELTFRSIPPGEVREQPGGPRRQRYYHDFFNYSGLHRSVWLYTTPIAHIADVTVVTDVEGATGVVRCTTTVDGEVADVRLALHDADGVTVARGMGADAELRVEQAELWRPGQGYLYDLQIDLVDGDRLVDRYTLPVGIRTVRVDGRRFLVNEQPFYFRGFGMHEDLNIRGKGHDDVAMVHDFELLRWIGANSFRTSHYPYAEEVLDHADRLGIVVIDETAAVGLNLRPAGAQGPARQTFSEATIGSHAQDVHRQAILELIGRDKNHPCVVLWSIANEPESDTESARRYFEPLFGTVREADPARRPVGFTNVLLSPPDRCLVSGLADIVAVNRYYGWYTMAGDLAAAERALEAELRAWAATHDKPILVSEYGADAMPGLHSLEANVWSEEYQAAVLEMSHRVFDRIDAVVGEHVWNFADFATGPSFIRVDGNKKGVFTRERRPKAAAHVLRRRWRGEA